VGIPNRNHVIDISGYRKLSSKVAISGKAKRSNYITNLQAHIRLTNTYDTEAKRGEMLRKH
jgi:hypothetical protein